MLTDRDIEVERLPLELQLQVRGYIDAQSPSTLVFVAVCQCSPFRPLLLDRQTLCAAINAGS